MKVQRQTHDIEIYRGDSIYEELTVLDADDAAVDVTGYTFRSQVRRHKDGDVLANLDVVVDDATTGTLHVYGAPELTLDLDLGPDDAGVWDLESTSDDATPIVLTSHAGAISYVKDVTE